MNTVIIQFLETPEKPFTMPGPEEDDNTRIILDYADKTPDMEVFVGLRYNPRFVETKNWKNDDFAKGLNAPWGEADQNINLVEQAWESYSTGRDGKSHLGPPFSISLPSARVRRSCSGSELTACHFCRAVPSLGTLCSRCSACKIFCPHV